MENKCNKCGTTFKVKPSRSDSKYCSMKCRRNGKEIPCQVCGVIKYYSPNIVANNKFCSRKCRNKSQEKTVYRPCKLCNIEIKLTPSFVKWHDIRGYKHYFCSKKCEHQYKSGENHINWIKDRSKLKDQNKSIRWSKEMIEWRSLVYQRDDYTCKLCNARGGYLNAHHIKKFADYPDLRFSIDNGITLCENCHQLTKKREEKFEDMFLSILRN